MAPAAPAPNRVVAVDAYRGFVMLLMMGEVLALGAVAAALPGSGFWRFLAHHQSHVEWTGASLHDLIQPSFSFLVGVAMPFSLAARAARGESPRRMLAHALWRSLLLVALGIFLRSIGRPQTNFTFEDTLTQIGLGYPWLFLLGQRSPRAQWAALAAILVGYFAAFALYPLPGPGFDWAAAGVPPDWAHDATGFAAHWNKNTNLAWAFDRWFLNLWPRPRPFTHNGGGYATLSFVPTLGTMILGLVAGRWLREPSEPRRLVRRLLVAGAIGVAAGEVLHLAGVCPNVKRIWTPTWVLWSGGCCFLLLAAFYYVIEMRGARRWAFPLLVTGANSIAAYLIAHLFEGFITGALTRHVGEGAFRVLGAPYAPLVRGALVLLWMWLILLWMYRRKLFLKI